MIRRGSKEFSKASGGFQKILEIGDKFMEVAKDLKMVSRTLNCSGLQGSYSSVLKGEFPEVWRGI